MGILNAFRSLSRHLRRSFQKLDSEVPGCLSEDKDDLFLLDAYLKSPDLSNKPLK